MLQLYWVGKKPVIVFLPLLTSLAEPVPRAEHKAAVKKAPESSLWKATTLGLSWTSGSSFKQVSQSSSLL